MRLSLTGQQMDDRGVSELAEPHKLLSYLLQPRIVSLSSDIVAVYLHAVMKVFGSWAAELADRWDDDELTKVRGIVDDAVERLTDFVTHPDIEVQERVRVPCFQVLAFRSILIGLLGICQTSCGSTTSDI